MWRMRKPGVLSYPGRLIYWRDEDSEEVIAREKMSNEEAFTMAART